MFWNIVVVSYIYIIIIIIVRHNKYNPYEGLALHWSKVIYYVRKGNGVLEKP